MLRVAPRGGKGGPQWGPGRARWLPAGSARLSTRGWAAGRRELQWRRNGERTTETAWRGRVVPRRLPARGERRRGRHPRVQRASAHRGLAYPADRRLPQARARPPCRWPDLARVCEEGIPLPTRRPPFPVSFRAIALTLGSVRPGQPSAPRQHFAPFPPLALSRCFFWAQHCPAPAAHIAAAKAFIYVAVPGCGGGAGG